ncbi:caffeic acid 3-O-methyltransferase-like [Pistacia vera]|uniref:caffeic acid 3-O-methyltransferase-like n=1 Tax=Pistacia vera TaxID=55513 RepID=UPI001262CDCB|nr:caffeic acid 3-O-methyltransferase-like [Pistacia vera]
MNSEENQMKTSTNEEDDHMLGQYAMQLVSASVLPMVLKETIELGVLDIIDKAGPGGQLSSSQIAAQLVTQNKPQAPSILDRILRLLASHSILTCSLTSDHDGGQVDCVYGLAPVAKYFIRNQDGGCLAPLPELVQDKVMLDMWHHLKEAVVEGELPFNKAYGMSAVEYVGKDAKLGEIFKDSMKDFNPIFMQKILEIYKGFDGLKSLVDVGGGDGFILKMIISKYPAIKGVNYDLPSTIEKSTSYPGIEHVAGDMFIGIPKGEAIFMKWILHSWDDEHRVKILKNCYEALPANGKVIVVDLVIPEAPETILAPKSLFQLDMFMMNMNSRGKERTRKEFQSLGEDAGYSHIQVPCSAFNFSVIEFYKSM